MTSRISNLEQQTRAISMLGLNRGHLAQRLGLTGVEALRYHEKVGRPYMEDRLREAIVVLVQELLDIRKNVTNNNKEGM